MTRDFSLLAQLDGLNPLNGTTPVTKSTGLVFMNILAILATGITLGLVLLLWARYHVRQRKRRRHHHHQDHRADATPSSIPNDEEEMPAQDGHRHRRRRRRRDHRPRNPTLGETGGLPPTKAEPSSNPPL